MPFVSGLGEIRSAEFIKRFLMASDNSNFRSGNNFMSHQVHYNAVGFINASKFNNRGSKGDRALDCTRIHPEFYSIATKMAKSAIDDDQDGEDAIKAILKDPSKLRQLDLDQFSQRCESMFGKDYKTIFYFIRDELESPFRDIRGEFAEYESKMVNQDANVFYMLTGENQSNFFEGLLVPVIITREVKDDTFGCRSLTKSAWTAYLHRDNVAECFQENLHPGYVLTAKITKIEYERLSVSLSCMNEEITEKEILDRISNVYRPHFKVDLENDTPTRTVTESKNRYGPGRKYKARSFGNYPHFKNVTVGQAISFLEPKPRGTFILRPSPRGERWLNLSMKLYDNHLIHVEINEEKLDEEESRFHIKDQMFESLKEIEQKYIRELNKRIADITKSPKFIKVSDEKELDDILVKRKISKPKSIPYGFTILPQYPQHAVFAYIPSKNVEKVRKEFCKIKSNGFFFHDIIHKTSMEVLVYFTKNFQTKTYRRYVESKKRKVPSQRVITNFEEEPVRKAPSQNQVSEWEADAGVDQTPFPANTNYVGEVSQSDWNNGGSQHDNGAQSSWGNTLETKKEVKDESGWGNDDDSGFQKPKNDNSWGDDDNNTFSQGSSRGGYRGRGRGRGGYRNDRGGGGDRGCFKCGETGHFARECPNEDSNDRRGGDRRGGGGDRACFK